MNRYSYTIPFVIGTFQRWSAKDPKSHDIIIQKRLPKNRWLVKKYVYCRKAVMLEISTDDLIKGYKFYE